MPYAETDKSVHVLLVEDNPADSQLVVEVLRDAAGDYDVFIVRNGREALAALRREGDFADRPRADIVLLDLKMPEMDGFEFLARAKGDVHLRRTPVIVLSSSRAEQDIARAYDLCANCYVVKPIDLDDFLMCLELIMEFWVERAELPSE